MEAKKTPKADLEKKKGLFLEIGLVVILLVVMYAFNRKSYDQEELVVNTRTAEAELEEEILNTEEDVPEPEPPQEVPAPEVVTEIEIVDNDKVIENEVTFNAEDDGSAMQEYHAPVVENKEEEVKEEEIFMFVEETPEFPGGLEEMYKYLRENIEYPDAARTADIQGKVFVKFVVEKNGKITNVKVLRDIGGGCGQEAKRVVEKMPQWKPGKQRGQAVRCEFNLPVDFKLN